MKICSFTRVTIPSLSLAEADQKKITNLIIMLDQDENHEHDPIIIATRIMIMILSNCSPLPLVRLASAE